MVKYCWSIDGDTFVGECETRVEALEEAREDALLEWGPGSTGSVWTARLASAADILKECSRTLVNHLIDEANDLLADEIECDYHLLVVNEKAQEELAKLLCDFLAKHTAKQLRTTRDVLKHEIEFPLIAKKQEMTNTHYNEDFILYDFKRGSLPNWAQLIWLDPRLAEFNSTFKTLTHAREQLRNFRHQVKWNVTAIATGIKERGYFTNDLAKYYSDHNNIGLARVHYIREPE